MPKQFIYLDDVPARKPRTRKDMIAYLTGHFRYDTMSSWNRATSYAHNVKVFNINLPPDEPKGTRDAMYELLDSEDSLLFSGFSDVLRDFDSVNNYSWQIGSNGRSSGYLVLYQGGQKPSGYKSRCTACGQLNFTKVMPEAKTSEEQLRNYVRTHPFWGPEIYPEQEEVKALGLSEDRVFEIVRETMKEKDDKGNMPWSAGNQCGKCHQPARVNMTSTHMQVFTRPGLGLDMDRDYADWDVSSLRSRVDVVYAFDMACNHAVECYVNFARTHHVEEQTILVEKKVNVCVEN